MNARLREGVIWLAHRIAGESTKAIAARVGLSIRSIQLRLQQAREWLGPLERMVPQYDRIELLMEGPEPGRCEHRVRRVQAVLKDGTRTYLCLWCNETNNPTHPAFRRGVAIPQPKPPPKFQPKRPRRKGGALPAGMTSAKSARLSKIKPSNP